MKILFSSFTGNLSVKNDCRQCLVIFPKRWENLSRYLKGYINAEFNIDCKDIIYEGFDKAKVVEINNALQSPCILIIGYIGKISHEVAYKLGLAHGCQKNLILVRLGPLDQLEGNEIPVYVRTNFFVTCIREKLPDFLDEISILLAYLLSGNLSKMLYYKALDICFSLERDSECHIDKVDEKIFLKLLAKKKRKSSIQTLDTVAYINDHDNLYWELIFLIASNQEQIAEAFLSIHNKFKDKPKAVSRNVRPIIINQFGQGDNVAGNKISK